MPQGRCPPKIGAVKPLAALRLICASNRGQSRALKLPQFYVG